MLIINANAFMKKEDIEKEQERLEKLCDEKVLILPACYSMAENKVLYLCDGRACNACHPDDCKHTRDIRHAKNFKMFSDIFIEQE